MSLSERSWDAGITHIADRLVELGLRRPVSQVRFPKPLRIVPRALAADELQQKLREHPGWEVCTGKIPGNDATRTEIRKAFEFRSFEDAMDFMEVAAAHISQVRYQPWNVQHHPRWENLWRTVTVWLSTWDNQHVISEVDFLLAEYLDELYQSTYKPQKQGDKVAAP
jgi:pterin-4a-carbinolamine dehydratase